jgi:hypothetical protein
LRLFLAIVSVNLAVGLVSEWLTEKRSEKKKFKQFAASVLPAISFFSPDELFPFVSAIVDKDPTRPSLPQFPKFFPPMVSPIPAHLARNVEPIADILAGRHEQSRDAKASSSACALFLES